MIARMERARALAAMVEGVAATDKPRPGRRDVTFGRAKNLGTPEVSYNADAFDAMTDDAILADLRARWAIPAARGA